MANDEPVERLSEVLSELQDYHAEDDDPGSRSMNVQVEALRQVQEQMKTQLKLHDAQIAALREVIALLGGDAD